MRIPEFNIDRFVDALERNRRLVDSVMETFNAGAFIKGDLEKLAAAARRTAHVCDELVRWQLLKQMVISAAKKDRLDEFGWS